jgi:hypothetical protein
LNTTLGAGVLLERWGVDLARVGEEHGPFDANLIKIGAYAAERANIHLPPEEAGLRLATRRLGECVAPANCPAREIMVAAVGLSPAGLMT